MFIDSLPCVLEGAESCHYGYSLYIPCLGDNISEVRIALLAFDERGASRDSLSVRVGEGESELRQNQTGVI